MYAGGLLGPMGGGIVAPLLPQLAGSLRVRVEQARFVFETDARVPLSWMLTRQEQARIHTIWRAIETRTHPEDPLGVTDQLFPRQPGT